MSRVQGLAGRHHRPVVVDPRSVRRRLGLGLVGGVIVAVGGIWVIAVIATAVSGETSSRSTLGPSVFLATVGLLVMVAGRSVISAGSRPPGSTRPRRRRSGSGDGGDSGWGDFGGSDGGDGGGGDGGGGGGD